MKANLFDGIERLHLKHVTAPNKACGAHFSLPQAQRLDFINLLKWAPYNYILLLSLGIFLSSRASRSFFLWKCGAASCSHSGLMGRQLLIYSFVVCTSS